MAFILKFVFTVVRTSTWCYNFFYLVTLTLKFDIHVLLFNVNLDRKFQTRRCRGFILNKCISCGKTFHVLP